MAEKTSTRSASSPAGPATSHGEPVPVCSPAMRRSSLDDGADLLALGVVDRHDDLECLAVLARERRRQRA